tara:strand:+ start:38 stop:556 length:519 start_codon:yes stop_codon:yes gene_type:complete
MTITEKIVKVVKQSYVIHRDKLEANLIRISLPLAIMTVEEGIARGLLISELSLDAEAMQKSFEDLKEVSQKKGKLVISHVCVQQYLDIEVHEGQQRGELTTIVRSSSNYCTEKDTLLNSTQKHLVKTAKALNSKAKGKKPFRIKDDKVFAFNDVKKVYCEIKFWASTASNTK